jgi:hypothetical protein
MANQKSRVIELLFNERWDAAKLTVSDAVVTLVDVAKYIRETESEGWSRPPLSDKNPANFFKDFVRNRRSANANWPVSVFERGYTGEQMTGGNACFRFIPLRAGQTEAFAVNVPIPLQDAHRHEVESVSMPLASRRLGRVDESWLIQVVVRLHIVETHMSLYSSRRNVIRQIDHLQMSVKLRNSEIDAIFLVVEEAADGEISEAILCCEAKGLRDDILENQIARQVQAVFNEVGQDLVIPLAVKVIGISEIRLVEFNAVSRPEADSLDSLVTVSDQIYRLVPEVPGIGTTRLRPKRKPRVV